ncbi:hypothetical protein GCM10009304_38070 [Pseudomonas matsuisoli]|uniref:Uncharacterized protein n=1 Tax=Pseudomonas matsuisoli TaxID=1515666 RepID=A0A917Q2U0_9PSED|nr:hypothetical protein GCM10009304_38070 [Pseudomonas matsuisoli]
MDSSETNIQSVLEGGRRSIRAEISAARVPALEGVDAEAASSGEAWDIVRTSCFIWLQVTEKQLRLDC